MHNGCAIYYHAENNDKQLVITQPQAVNSCAAKIAHHHTAVLQKTPSAIPNTTLKRHFGSIPPLSTMYTQRSIVGHAKLSFHKKVSLNQWMSFKKEVVDLTIATGAITIATLISGNKSINSDKKKKRRKTWCHFCKIDCENIIYCSGTKKDIIYCQMT